MTVFVRLNEEQEIQLSELSRNISESSVSAEEHSKLLEQSHNDKTTISRALMQNKQLKQQLEEMQEGFVKLVSYEFYFYLFGRTIKNHVIAKPFRHSSVGRAPAGNRKMAGSILTSDVPSLGP